MRTYCSYLSVLVVVLLLVLCQVARADDTPPPPSTVPPPNVQDIAIRGLEHISADMLGRINQLVPRAQIGLPYDDAAAQTEKTALLALGWYAAVDTTIEPVLDGVRLVFTVKENPTVLQVQVEGLKICPRCNSNWCFPRQKRCRTCPATRKPRKR